MTTRPSPTSLPLVPNGSSGPRGPHPHGRPPRHLTSHQASRRPPPLLQHRVSMTQLCFPLPVCSIARQICTDLWRHNGEQDTPAPAPSPPWPASLHAEGTLEARTTHPCRPAKAACEKRRDSLGFTAGGGTVMKRKLFNIISLSLWVSILKTRPRAALGEMKPGILNNQSQETVSHLATTGGVS